MATYYKYSVNSIRSIVGNTIKVNVIRYKVVEAFGEKFITSLNKWKIETIQLTPYQRTRLDKIADKDKKKAYLTKLLGNIEI